MSNPNSESSSVDSTSQKEGKTTNETRQTPATPVAAYRLFEQRTHTRDRILFESEGRFQGPMRVESFFEEFMPWNEAVEETYRNVRPSPSRLATIRNLPGCGEGNSYRSFVRVF